MPYVPFNNNPSSTRVGDCAVRAVSVALGISWDDAYIGLCAEGLYYHDMPSSNYVWGMYLKSHGFVQKVIPSVCPACITVDHEELDVEDDEAEVFLRGYKQHSNRVCYHRLDS